MFLVCTFFLRRREKTGGQDEHTYQTEQQTSDVAIATDSQGVVPLNP